MSNKIAQLRARQSRIEGMLAAAKAELKIAEADTSEADLLESNRAAWEGAERPSLRELRWERALHSIRKHAECGYAVEEAFNALYPKEMRRG
jgi:hypothetical protein